MISGDDNKMKSHDIHNNNEKHISKKNQCETQHQPDNDLGISQFKIIVA